MKEDFKNRVQRVSAEIREKVSHKPRIGIILGSGLSGIAQSFGGDTISYGDIRGFPAPTVQGHSGVLYSSDRTAVLAGRFHYYEGKSMDDIVLPVFALHALGVENLIVTNACGGINSSFHPGDLVLIKDHINLMGMNPLIGLNDESLGPRFPDMTQAYSKDFCWLAERVAGKAMKAGVYAALPGPSYETPAEIRMLKAMGADMVGMSTVPEVIAAAYLGMHVLGISCITNYAAGLGNSPLDHKEVVETGKKVEAELGELLHGVVSHLE